ncbi:MAG: peptidoglycan-binding domain-containing protein [Bryobacteraceae bacterium]
MALIQKLTATLLAAVLSPVGVYAQTAPKKTPPAKAFAKPLTKTTAAKSTSTKANVTRATVTRATATKAGATRAATSKASGANGTSAKTKSKVKPPSRAYGQMQPGQERYKEIQQALLDRGYFRGQADGLWGSDSADALKRFQLDQNLDADGKISSLSLIALGLGPRRGTKSDDAAHAQEAGAADVTPPPFTAPANPPQDAN